MEQTTGTSSQAAAAAAPSPPQDTPPPSQEADGAQPAGAEPAAPDTTGFGARGRIRRRARFLRKARELAYRDLGGLVYNLHRFGQRNDQLVLAKLTLLGQIDHELRTLEGALGERRAMTILREAGVTVCARCAAIHSSEDRYCPNCGLSLGRHPDLPIAGTAGPGAAAAPPQVAAAPVAPATGSYPQAVPAAVAPVTAAHAVTPAPAASQAPATGAPAAAKPAAPEPGPSPAPAARPFDPPTEPHRTAGSAEDTEIIRPPATGS